MRTRRFTQFSLRSLLLAITGIAIWLGVQEKWIADRNHAIRWMRDQAEFWDDLPVDQTVHLACNAPLRIRMLGADGLESVCVVVAREDEIAGKKRELESLFPEARIIVATPGSGYHGKRSEFLRSKRREAVSQRDGIAG